MFWIDDHYISNDDNLAQCEAIAERLAELNVAQKAMAVWTRDTKQWLSLVLWARIHEVSLAPLHADLPRAAAEASAQKMGCHLFWDDSGDVSVLSQSPHASTPGLVQFSSGTTGEPKLISRTWSSIDREIEAYNRAMSVEAASVPVIACPVTHSYGLISGFLAACDRGVQPHVVTGWNPKHLLQVLDSHRRPLLYSSPALFSTLLMLWPAHKSLHAAMTSGTTLPNGLFNELKCKVRRVYQQYGCSEIGCISIAHQPRHNRDIGLPLEHLSVGCGPGPEAPSELQVSSADARVDTGDLAYREGDGRLVFCTRIDDTIIVSGLNVYPVAVEEALMQMPGIDDVVVFKIDGGDMGDRVAMIYQGRETLAASEIRAWCVDRLAPFQWPTFIQRVDSIPRLPNGKVSRKALANRFDPRAHARDSEVA